MSVAAVAVTPAVATAPTQVDSEVNTAIADSLSGATIKPVLTF